MPTAAPVYRPPGYRTPKQADKARGTRTERGYNNRWLRAAKNFLILNPLCQCLDCDGGRKRTVPATVVDHRIPHKGDMELFWDESNWQAMAKNCHDKKTAREDGGFGR